MNSISGADLQLLEGDGVVDGGQLGQETKHHDALQGGDVAAPPTNQNAEGESKI